MSLRGRFVTVVGQTGQLQAVVNTWSSASCQELPTRSLPERAEPLVEVCGVAVWLPGRKGAKQFDVRDRSRAQRGLTQECLVRTR